MGFYDLDRLEADLATDLEKWLETAYPGWTATDPRDICAGFVCPHGNGVEVDGTSFDGCVSPMLQEGM